MTVAADGTLPAVAEKVQAALQSLRDGAWGTLLEWVDKDVAARRRRAVIGAEDKTGEYQRRDTARQRDERDGRVAQRPSSALERRTELPDRICCPVDEEQPPGTIIVTRCRIYLGFDDFVDLRADRKELAIADLAVAAGIGEETSR
jgi:hypothetical protein